ERATRGNGLSARYRAVERATRSASWGVLVRWPYEFQHSWIAIWTSCGCLFSGEAFLLMPRLAQKQAPRGRGRNVNKPRLAVAPRSNLEVAAQVHIERPLVLVVEPVTEVQRAQRRLVAEKQAGRIDVAAVEFVVVVPGAPTLQRSTEVQRKIQRRKRARRQAAQIDHPAQADVLPRQRILAEAGQLPSAAEQEAGGHHFGIIQGAAVASTQ